MELNTDTKRSLKEIEKNGYYFQGQTLGEGGWSSLRILTLDWKKYKMYDEGIEVDSVTAKDDETALTAFGDKHNPEFVENCEVVEYIITLRHIN